MYVEESERVATMGVRQVDKRYVGCAFWQYIYAVCHGGQSTSVGPGVC